MALTLTNDLRDDIADQIDTSMGTACELRFETSGDAEVATITCQNPAFGPSSAGVITMAGLTLSDTSATGGTIAQFSMFDTTPSPDEKQLEGTVTGISGGGDIEITSLVIVNTEQVDLTTFTITVPAS